MTELRRKLRRLRGRKGIVLLLVVSLLTLFVLIGVTYAVVASTYRDTAKIQAGRQLVGDPPEREIENVLYVLLRDSLVKGPFQYHSLLYDLYGDDGSKEVLAADAVEENGGQVWKLQLDNATNRGNLQQPFGRALSDMDDYYAGQTVTFITGPARGNTTVVLRYDSTGKNLYVEAPGSDQSAKTPPKNGDQIILNGKPFNGTGFGYDTASHNITATTTAGSTSGLVALLPNFGGYASPPNLNYVRGADEGWDAADFQNPWLAFTPADSSTTNVLLPSWHRPDLVNYWAQAAGGSFSAIPPEIRRMIMFRPTTEDHPNFTGGNPYFNPTSLSGPYDVDNDGDGKPDSVWVDPRLPVLTAPDGRRYKRLVAVMIKDLDGRVQLNAHGSVRLQRTYDDTTLAETAFSAGAAGAFAGIPNGTATLKLPRGLGFGPAEVLFRHMLASDSDYQNLLYGRYGADQRPGSPNDFFWVLKHYGIPQNQNQVAANRPSTMSQTMGNNCMSPIDPWGRGLIGLDANGQPMQFGAGRDDEVTSGSNWDMPYMTSAGASPQKDETPYSALDMEALLRYYDADARRMSTRIMTAAQSSFDDTASSAAVARRRREMVTTMAAHIAAPRVNVPNELRGQGPFNGPTSAETAPTVADLFRARMGAGYSQQALNVMLAWELRQGKRFNLNRYLGNGLDDDNDGTTDETDEIANEYAWNEGRYPTSFYQKTPYIVNDVDVNAPSSGSGIHDPTTASGSRNQQADRLLAKHLYCRHLYCLMWAVFNGGFTPTHPAETLSQQQQSELFSRRIAQWVVNVVDFRDPDSIMTPFEYDMNPGNGWDVDGDIAGTSTDNNHNDRRLVWGMEAPDLLMTEVTAFHARRTRDTDNDSPEAPQTEAKKIGPNPMDDKDTDQYRMPQGSMYIEFYCPKTRMTSPGSTGRKFQYPTELYTYDSGNNRLVLDMDRTVSQSNGMSTVTSPVWQVVISEQYGSGSPKFDSSVQQLATTKPLSANFDPTNPSLLPTGGSQPLNIDRRVLFTRGVPNDSYAQNNQMAEKTFYNMGRNGWPDMKVTPGQYAMVGPRPMTALGSNPPGAGMGAAQWGGDSQQKVEMSGDWSGTGFTYTDQSGAQTQKTNVVCMVAEAPPPPGWTTLSGEAWRQGINISEPLASRAQDALTLDMYYKEPQPTPTNPPYDAYSDLDLGEKRLPDLPFEQMSNPKYPSFPLNDASVFPQSNNQPYPPADQTYQNVRSIYLQRLADPTKVYDQNTNPYITVDWTTADLTVFGGEEQSHGAGQLFFKSREKGHSKQNPDRNANVWYPATVPHHQPTTAGGGSAYFKHDLVNTFGYLNNDLDTPDGNGLPSNSPFPWPAWLDRPFANPAELLLVPWAGPSRFGFELDKLPALTTNANTNLYDPNSFLMFARNPAPGNEPAAYGFLPNFHSSTQLGTGGNPSADLYRLFDFVETPSPYSGTEKWFNPDSTNSHFGDGNPSAGATGPLYRPPFNNRSLNRDPGRINVNTINDPQVWEAIAKQYPYMDPSVDGQSFYNKLIRSRQGYAGGAYAVNSGYPTIFANPFRSGTSADIMPDVPSGAGSMRQQLPVNATLLRQDPDTNNVPLFSFASQSTMTQIGDITRNKLNNSDRNAFFKHQPLAKVANMLTTNSNCFAVWITVGYFEVEDAPTGYDPNVYPDGLRLAGEVGALSGDVKRHRGFYLIDRSIPVAFEPGENHNVDRCIVVRRMIE